MTSDTMVAKVFVTVLILVLAGFLIFAFAIYQNNLPLTSQPGMFNRLKIYLTNNTAETTGNPELPELAIREFQGSAGSLLDDSRKAAQSLGWEIVSFDADRDEIHAIVTTPLLSFKDDVVIRILPGNGSRKAVYVHAASRVGRGDLGTNSRHILDFYQALERLHL